MTSTKDKARMLLARIEQYRTPTGYKTQAIDDVAGAITAAVEEATENADLAVGCLDMIRDRLIGLGCKCGPDAHEATPPMMYPEWINCCLIKRIEDEREACAKAAEHLHYEANEQANLSSRDDELTIYNRYRNRASMAQVITRAIRARGTL